MSRLLAIGRCCPRAKTAGNRGSPSEFKKRQRRIEGGEIVGSFLDDCLKVLTMRTFPFFVVFLSAAVATAADPDGSMLFRQNCAVCHGGNGNGRAPAASALGLMSAESVLRALDSGLMREQGSVLSANEKRVLAEFLSGRKIGEPTRTTTGFCPPGGAGFAPGGSAWNGWSTDTTNARFQSAQAAGLSSAEVPRLRLKWAFAFPDTFIANAQPSITGGRIFVPSANRHVYSLDARTGCQYWSFEAEAPVRTAMTVATLGGDRPRHVAFFGDQRANTYALDASNGELLWKVRADDHPRAKMVGSPTYFEGRLYVPVTAGEEGPAVSPKYECCSARGALLALDAATGRQIWKTYTIAETPRVIGHNKEGTPIWGPSGASIWSAPTVDSEKKLLYASTGDNFSGRPTENSDAVVAFDMLSGRIIWSKQLTGGDVYNNACISSTRQNCPDENGPDADIASSPILIRTAAGKRLLLVGQKSGVFHALDPDRKGEIVWQTRVGAGGIVGGIMFGSATDGKRVFVAISDLKFATETINAGNRWNPKFGGGITALDVVSGRKLWAAPPGVCDDRPNCAPAQSAAVTGIPGAVFSGSFDSHLRAYSAEDGTVLWDFDTYRRFETVNGLTARGGALTGGGPAVIDGTVYAGAGSVLLAFSIDGH